MLIDRVRRALAPDYEILSEVAGGGMGLVFAARQLRLDRKVAIKILRPEHATAVAVERFLTEGRLLARLSHPNIVPVYDAGESDGLLYYVMEYVEGETLADRLTRGPLPPEETLGLAHDLLGALAAAHVLGVVHRDVKPANIFLRNGRALLGDFGIARWREKNQPGYTTPGEVVGTPRYMSPEQREGTPATIRTDIYAAGLVIYEACTGKRWAVYQDPETADWKGVPPRLAGPLRKALQVAPDARWTSVAEFIGALERKTSRRRIAVLAGIGLVVAGLAVLLVWPPRPPANAGRGVIVQIGRFEVQGESAPQDSTLGDSVATHIRNLLAGYPDFDVHGPEETSSTSAAIRVGGLASISGGQLSLRASENAPSRGDAAPIEASRNGSKADWHSLADSLALLLVYQIWQRVANDPYFPGHAIPTSVAGRARLAKAEMFFSLGHWEPARDAYSQLLDDDSSCYLCLYRLLDVNRWLAQPGDTVMLTRLVAAQDRFPEPYRQLINAAATSLPDRFEALHGAAHAYSGFFLASFEYGDELFNRGALYGHRRAEALDPFRQTVLSRPGFQPGWQELTWLLMSEGDSVAAARALASLTGSAPASGLSAGLRLLLTLGFNWRYGSSQSAQQWSEAVLADTLVVGYREAPAAARLLMSMDAPTGAVEFGRLLEKWQARDDGVTPGLLGQLYGYAALGQLDSVRAIRRRLAQRSLDRSLPLLALELEAVLRAFDPDPSVWAEPNLLADLERAATHGAGSPELRRQAAFALGLLALRAGDPVRFDTAQSVLAQEPPPARLRAILHADSLGAGGDPAAALLNLPTIPILADEKLYYDLLEDAVAHFLRAEWLEKQRSYAKANETLRWHEHLHITGHLMGEPQAGEMAWALGTLARWRRAQLLKANEDEGSDEWCSVNRNVARLWKGAPHPFGARADSAARVVRESRCTSP